MSASSKLKVLDLFSGLGGFSLGLERTGGFETVAFCEIDEFCRSVLRKHWPNVPVYDDVRELNAARLRADGIKPDVICGGFPCTDISLAGKGAGLEGEQSGLWREFARLIGELRPRHVLVENVGALRGRGLVDVLRNLAALSYVGQAHAVPAAAIGAPHLRDRVWIIGTDAADTTGLREGQQQQCSWAYTPGHSFAARDGTTRGSRSGPPEGCAIGRDKGAPALTDPDRQRLRQHEQRPPAGRYDVSDGGQTKSVDDGSPWVDPDSNSERCEQLGFSQHGLKQGASRRKPDGLGPGGRRHGSPESGCLGSSRRAGPAAEPGSERRQELRGLFGRLAGALAATSAPWPRPAFAPLRRVDDGLPPGVDRRSWVRQERARLKALGNSVVPLIPQIIGQALLDLNARSTGKAVEAGR